MRRLMTILVVFGLVVSLAASPAFAEEGTEESAAGETAAVYTTDEYGLSLSAECAILIDGDTGRVLYERNAEQQHLIASTTKIMTAMVALQHTDDLDAMYTIQPEWTGIEGSSMYLVPEESVSMRALLYGLMLASGNDAATAIANIVGGDEATFVDWMNEEAAALGMDNTHFANPHGLDAEDHYSTAHDMARLMAEAMKNSDFREITHTRYVEIDGHEIYFHNKLLNMYEYCISGKTGYTMAAGRTLVTASEKDGMLLICVTLNAWDDWNDQIKIYDFGFQRYTRSDYSEAGEYFDELRLAGTYQKVPIYYAGACTCLHRLDDNVVRTVYLPDELTAAVEKGAVVGEVVYSVEGNTIAISYLVAGAYANTETGEVSDEWKSEFKNSYLLGGLYPDAQPNGTYRMEGLLSTAASRSWG